MKKSGAKPTSRREVYAPETSNDLLRIHPDLLEEYLVALEMPADKLLVIDHSVLPRAGLIVVAVLNGGYVLRRLVCSANGLSLIARDGQTPSLLLSDDEDSSIWGVVIHAIHHLSGSPARR